MNDGAPIPCLHSLRGRASTGTAITVYIIAHRHHTIDKEQPKAILLWVTIIYLLPCSISQPIKCVLIKYSTKHTEHTHTHTPYKSVFISNRYMHSTRICASPSNPFCYSRRDHYNIFASIAHIYSGIVVVMYEPKIERESVQKIIIKSFIRNKSGLFVCVPHGAMGGRGQLDVGGSSGWRTRHPTHTEIHYKKLCSVYSSHWPSRLFRAKATPTEREARCPHIAFNKMRV